MKTLTALLITLTLLATGRAHAGFLCKGQEPAAKVTLKLIDAKQTRAHTMVLSTPYGSKIFGAITKLYEPGKLFEKEVFSVWDTQGVYGTLTVVTKTLFGRGGGRGGLDDCGRAGCGTQLKTITAVLDYYGAQTKFFCQKI